MLEHLEPHRVWHHFEQLCAIPHPSGHERNIAEYLLRSAASWGLRAVQDKVGNVIVYKKQSTSHHGASPIILQSHMDMVPQKNSTTVHNFLTDPIRPRIVDGWVMATGTTLGADNGLGVAIICALLESTTISHGPIEALFTIDEERGLSGALGLAPDLLTGKYLINLDTENENELCIGCAGGIDASATVAPVWEHCHQGLTAYNLTIRGLRGGHSGIDIHRGRGNALKILTRLLFAAGQHVALRLCSIEGGTARNAIPREASASVVLPPEQVDAFERSVSSMQKIIAEELRAVEPDFTVSTAPIALPSLCISLDSQQKLIAALYACPNGVIRMSNTLPGVVETSSNLAMITQSNGTITIACLLRSSQESCRVDLQNSLAAALSIGSNQVTFSGGYPGWVPDRDAPLLTLMQDAYRETYNKNPAVVVVHAGLECGIIGAPYPAMQMISCGPTIEFPHSPDERVHIASVGRFWNYLITVLNKIR